MEVSIYKIGSADLHFEVDDKSDHIENCNLNNSEEWNVMSDWEKEIFFLYYVWIKSWKFSTNKVVM